MVAELFTYGFSTRAEGADRPRGIGLALVDRISRRLGGSVAVSSAGPDGGTVFTVRVPAPGRPRPRSDAHDLGRTARRRHPLRLRGPPHRDS